MSSVKDDVVNSSDHIVHLQYQRIEPSNRMRNDKAKSTTTSKSVDRWCKLLERHPSTERIAILLLSLLAVVFDPLFFYIPVVKIGNRTCLGLDDNLSIIALVFRSFVDALHTILWGHRSLSLGHGYRKILAWKVAILAILPLPQLVILTASSKLGTVRLLKFMVLFQFVPRICRIIPAYKDATRASDILRIYTWFAAAFNLGMYIIVSNVFGAFWYIRAVERNMDCWKETCDVPECGKDSPDCRNETERCAVGSNETSFDYGIYGEAIQAAVMTNKTNFQDKFFNCFWWGLRNLSNLGENLEPGSYTWDSLFAICIGICGLVLFAFFIGNMQTYLQSRTPSKLEKMKQRKNYLEGWKPFYFLPKDLRQKVMWCEDPKWQETTEVDLKSLLNNIPTKLRKRVKPHLCKDMFSKIPKFRNLRNQQRDGLCKLAKPLVFSQRSYIISEGDPIHELVFVVTGDLLCYSKQARIPTKQLSDGCFFGEELLQQLEQLAQQEDDPNESSLDLPIASKSVQAMTKVEAFVLPAKDLNKVFVGNRAWASSTIQGAWRNRAKAKREKKP